MWTLCLAEDSLETPSLIFSEKNKKQNKKKKKKQWKKYLWLSSAAVVSSNLSGNDTWDSDMSKVW